MSRSPSASVSKVTSAHSPFKVGDYDLTLPNEPGFTVGVSNRLDEIIRRFGTDCKEAETLKKELNGKMDAKLGVALCGSLNLAQQPLVAHFLLSRDASFSFRDPKGPESKAAAITMQSIKDFTPEGSTSDADATQMGIILFLLAKNALVDMIPIGTHNRIDGALVNYSASSAQPTASGCPKPEETTVCGCFLVPNGI